jgi:hypothetical protein
MIACCEGFIYLELGNVRDLGPALEFMASCAGASLAKSWSLIFSSRFVDRGMLLFLQVPLLALFLNGQASQQIAKKESSGP